jgi:hypothetical protein
MGSYVLYILTQAFVALIVAYFSGTLVFRERRLYMLLVSLGLYLILGSTLVEVWGDKAGWEAWAIGLNAALVATGVSFIGTGALLREADHMDEPPRSEAIAKVLIGVSALTGAFLASSGGSSDSIVDSGAITGVEISGTFSHLGPLGWALGSVLFAGALIMAWMGARAILARGDSRGFWLMGAAVLFLLWPFDLSLARLPLAPAILMMALIMTYFGFQLQKEEEEEGSGATKGDGMDEADPDVAEGEAEGPAPWVREAIAAREERSTQEGTEDDVTGDDVDTGPEKPE